MKLHDNIGIALAIIHHHGERFALTGGAVRRLVYAASGRVNTGGSGWCVGWARIVGKYVTRTLHGYRLTERGFAEVQKRYERRTLLTSEQCDPLAFLSDWERYVG